MRTRLLAALCLFAMTPRAFAQEAEETDPVDTAAEEPAADTSSETDASDVVKQGDRVRMRNPDDVRESAPGEVHTVVKGDTLWDLSQKYLGTPWYWPKVWSYNPEIANPHWIYPGNLVRFSSAGDEVPAQVEVDKDGASADDVDAPSELSGDDGVSVAGKIGYQGRNQPMLMTVDGFVTEKEIESAGTITGSFEEKEMLSFPDTAYVTFKNRGDVKVGDKYMVFRTDEDEVRHPVSGDKVGRITHILGTMKVVSLHKNVVKAQVTDSRDEIRRGHLVGPANEQLAQRLVQKANDKELSAVVVTALVPYLTLFGEHHVIVMDRGSADGVQPGNTFTIFRQQDLGGNFMEPQKDQDEELPKEDIAQCMAFDVKERFSTCVLTRSIREVVPGDRAEMRVNGGQPTASR